MTAMKFPEKLQNKLDKRVSENSFRVLTKKPALVDFSSNDYLGFAQSVDIYEQAHASIISHKSGFNGSTGSRLISGSHDLHGLLEVYLKDIHQSEAALVFNSGYDANLGLFSSLLQRNDTVFFDKLSHASIRDGIQLSPAKSVAFKHNNISHLEQKLIKHSKFNEENETYVVTESVFSMDGDSPDLIKLCHLCEKYNAKLIVDEAHALGVHGYGLVQQLNLSDAVFARVITFGKALGCHGAVVLGSEKLRNYLINFARSFIYTTALSPHSIAIILHAYKKLDTFQANELQDNIGCFIYTYKQLGMDGYFIKSQSAIHSCIISENSQVKFIADKLQEKFDVKAILAPTIPVGQERLRFCLHSFNTTTQIKHLLKLLKTCLKEYS
jgi:8-amino-7-oxononanoate synthase